MLYHSDSIVFGEAMVEAVKLEASISVYPRVVLSSSLAKQVLGEIYDFHLCRSTDGLYSLDYISKMIRNISRPGTSREYFAGLAKIINTNLHDRMLPDAARSKWYWFASEMKRVLSDHIYANFPDRFGIDHALIHLDPLQEGAA